jgi:hypothetical protein
MTPRTIVAIVAVAGVSVCGLISSIVFEDMVGAVNRRLPEGQQFAPLGWHWPKYQRLKTEYNRLYPDGRLLRKAHVLMALMFACLITCVWALGFFRW